MACSTACCKCSVCVSAGHSYACVCTQRPAQTECMKVITTGHWRASSEDVEEGAERPADCRQYRRMLSCLAAVCSNNKRLLQRLLPWTSSLGQSRAEHPQAACTAECRLCECTAACAEASAAPWPWGGQSQPLPAVLRPGRGEEWQPQLAEQRAGLQQGLRAAQLGSEVRLLGPAQASGWTASLPAQQLLLKLR